MFTEVAWFSFTFWWQFCAQTKARIWIWIRIINSDLQPNPAIFFLHTAEKMSDWDIRTQHLGMVSMQALQIRKVFFQKWKNFRALNVLLWTLIKVIYINLFRKREHLGDSVALEHKRGLWPALVFMPEEIDTPRFTYSGVNDPPRFILGWLTHQGLFWGEWPNEVYSGDFYPPGFLFPEIDPPGYPTLFP